jgi:outer membrane protein assembly factor BamB
MLSLFCSDPACAAYLGVSRPGCACGRKRPEHECLPEANQPLWQAELPGPGVGAPVFAGEQVLVGWSSRSAGGICAFSLANGRPGWEAALPAPLAGEMVLDRGQLFVCAGSFLDACTRLAALDPASGKILWNVSLPDGAPASGPVVCDQGVYGLTYSGVLFGVDRSSGKAIQAYPLRLPVGNPQKSWLVGASGCLAAVFGDGRIFAFQAATGKPLWNRPAELGCEITGAPMVALDHLYMGAAGDRIADFDLRRKSVHFTAARTGKVVAAPTLDEAMLLAGSSDHGLYFLDPSSGKEIAPAWFGKHGITAAPLASGGLVYLGVNGNSDGEFVALAAGEPEPFWRFPAAGERVLWNPARMKDGQVYVTHSAGQVFAFAWHLGGYARAGKWMEKRQARSEAAEFFAIASELERKDLAAQGTYAMGAIRNWRSAGAWGKAALFRETLAGQAPAAMAEEFENAARLCAASASQPAYLFLRRAASYYWDAGDEKNANRCDQQAARLTSGPYLYLRKIALPARWEAGEEQRVVFEVSNFGWASAERPRIRFGGELAQRMWVELESLAPGASGEIEVTLVAAAPGEIQVQTEIFCTGLKGEKLRFSRSYPVLVLPARKTLEVNGDVALLRLPDDQMVDRIRIRGDVGMVKFGVEKKNDPPQL